MLARMRAPARAVHLFARRHLPQTQKCLYQLAFATRNHARKSLEPRATRHLGFRIQPLRQQSELLDRDFSLQHPRAQMIEHGSRHALTADFRHWRRRRNPPPSAPITLALAPGLARPTFAAHPLTVPLATISAALIQPHAAPSIREVPENLPAAACRWQLQFRRQYSSSTNFSIRRLVTQLSKIFPGFRMPSGSSVRFNCRSSARLASPIASGRNFFLANP